ncbi:MAG: hypothetical protein IJQ06_00360 [Paludibacteraceae bacterium]|nr:hypothetical protein [Paludibacteraceae bacterium]
MATKKHYYIPHTEVMPLAASGCLMTSIQLPPDMGAPARRPGSNTEVF